MGAPILCPFTMTVEPMAAMLNFELADDPTYAGLEIQRFDDAIHGAGLAVLLMRRDDRRVDVYRQPGLQLDPASYGIGAGVGEWREADIEPAILAVTSTGVVADIGLRDAAGRRVAVRVDDRDGRPRSPAALLAPVSAAVEQPTAMLLVWMPCFDLVRGGRPSPKIQIDGRAAATGRLPLARFHGRHLIKYAANLLVVRLNPAQDGPIEPIDPERAPEVILARNQGSAAIDGVTAAAAGHEVRLEFDPPIPDLVSMADEASPVGAWRLTIDSEPSIVRGSWRASKTGDQIELNFDSIARWQPGRLPLLMRIVTRIVPTFRSWPTTYRWHATLDVDSSPFRMRSGWERVGRSHDESYGRLMRAPR